MSEDTRIFSLENEIHRQLRSEKKKLRMYVDHGRITHICIHIYIYMYISVIGTETGTVIVFAFNAEESRDEQGMKEAREEREETRP